MKSLNICLILFPVIGTICFECKQETSRELEKSIDSIFVEYDNRERPGAAVSVVKDGEVLFSKGYGSANLEYDIPVTSSTIFHIASVSKQFTVFSILLLVADGKIGFDDDVRKYIPEVPDFGKTITLRHLASHTSGLRDQWGLLAMAGWRLDDVITQDHILKLVSKQQDLNFAPGEEFAYCNTGFTLLAEVVARVSGESFAEFTKKRIFEPLGMTNTLFYDDHEKIVKNRAYSYYSFQGDYKKSVLSYANVGATSLFTTVEDLCQWALNFETPNVGNETIIKEMGSLATLNNGKTFGGAYGQFIEDYKGLNQIQHAGGDAGYRSYFARFPDQNFSISVLSNLDAANPRKLALNVADYVLKNDFPTISQKQEDSDTYIPSKEELKDIIGYYWTEKFSVINQVFSEDGELRFSVGNGSKPLKPIGENTFQLQDVGDAKVIVSLDKGEVYKAIHVTINDGVPRIGLAYQPVSYTSTTLKEFAGTFHSKELSTTYNFSAQDTSLIVTHAKNQSFNVVPLMEDTFIRGSWYFRNINFVRDESNSIIGIKVSSDRVKNLYFDKIDNYN
ncbi:MAG: serine hydrolase domain-containing protein [Bacteroidota bacterium]